MNINYEIGRITVNNIEFSFLEVDLNQNLILINNGNIKGIVFDINDDLKLISYDDGDNVYFKFNLLNGVMSETGVLIRYNGEIHLENNLMSFSNNINIDFSQIPVVESSNNSNIYNFIINANDVSAILSSVEISNDFNIMNITTNNFPTSAINPVFNIKILDNNGNVRLTRFNEPILSTVPQISHDSDVDYWLFALGIPASSAVYNIYVSTNYNIAPTLIIRRTDKRGVLGNIEYYDMNLYSGNTYLYQYTLYKSDNINYFDGKVLFDVYFPNTIEDSLQLSASIETRV